MWILRKWWANNVWNWIKRLEWNKICEYSISPVKRFIMIDLICMINLQLNACEKRLSIFFDMISFGKKSHDLQKAFRCHFSWYFYPSQLNNHDNNKMLFFSWHTWMRKMNSSNFHNISFFSESFVSSFAWASVTFRSPKRIFWKDTLKPTTLFTLCLNGQMALPVPLIWFLFYSLCSPFLLHM